MVPLEARLRLGQQRSSRNSARARRAGYPPSTVQELLKENRDNYHNIIKEDSPKKRHKKCGCLAKSNTVPISCVDNLQASDCRSKGFKANMKLLGDAKDMCLGIAEGTPTSGVANWQIMVIEGFN